MVTIRPHLILHARDHTHFSMMGAVWGRGYGSYINSTARPTHRTRLTIDRLHTAETEIMKSLVILLLAVGVHLVAAQIPERCSK